MDPTADDEHDEVEHDDEHDEHDEHDDDENDEHDEPTPLDLGSGDVVANARRRYGSGGALLAAGMLGLDKILTDKKKPDSVQVQEAASQPIDLDETGIKVTIDEVTSVEAPALERREPLGLKKKRSRRR